MRYVDTIRELYSLQRLGVRLGLDRLEASLEHRGNPHDKTRFVHIAGTNGKGSVASMVESIFRAAGYRTGLYTSPHMHRFTERIRVDGKPISQAEAAARADDLLRYQRRAESPLTFFETTTLLALEAFADAKCDIAVLEVGMGGRLDATNVVTPGVTTITRIALDHIKPLGRTLAAIAGEKAGILKRQVPLVSGATAPSAARVIERRARSLSVPILRLGRDIEVDSPHFSDRLRFDVRIGRRVVSDLSVPLVGEYQRTNAALAVATVRAVRDKSLRVDDDAVRKGLAAARWPGRLEWLPGRPRVLLDAAHNPDGCAALRDYVRSVNHNGRRVLLFGAMRDKDYGRMIRTLAPAVDDIIYCASELSRAMPARGLSRVQRGSVVPSVAEGVRLAQQRAGRDGTVIIAGSIFVVAAARAMLLGVRSDPPIPM